MIVAINNKQFPAELKTTPKERAQGMMGRNKLDGCMVFKLTRGVHSFWMRGCKIPLDIVFVYNKRISHIYPNCPAPEQHQLTLPRYKGMGDHVIEFPAGTASDFKVGDNVNLYLGSPLNPA